jgi:hypothetical protein
MHSPLRPQVCGIQKAAYMGKMVRERRKCVVYARKLTEYKRYILQNRNYGCNTIVTGLQMHTRSNEFGIECPV